VPTALLSLFVAGVAVVPGIADGPPLSKPATPAPTPLAQKDREQLAGLLKKVAPKAKPELAYAAMTMAEARRLANVPAGLKWQVEYDGWFVFGTESALGGPDEWSGVYFIRKGSNVTGYYRETW
jgi:hypothetical protein